MPSLLIINADCVNEGRRFEADMLIRDDRIEAIGADLSSREANRVIDAEGRLLIPGMIDDQVHFREPGLTHKADFTSESRAAVAGGITSFMEMSNSKPPTLSREVLEAKHTRAAEVSRANYSFYLGASNDNLEAIRSVQVGQSCGVKVFMGGSTSNALAKDRIDVVATDHARHTLDEKGQSYFKAPAGLPLVQDALPSLLEHVHDGWLSLEQAVSKTSHAVAECYGIEERGYLREGYWADLALIDLNAPYHVERSQMLAKWGWSPY